MPLNSVIRQKETAATGESMLRGLKCRSTEQKKKMKHHQQRYGQEQGCRWYDFGLHINKPNTKNNAFIQSDLQRVHVLKETAIYRCGT